MEEIIEGVTPQIIEKELIPDGTGVNYRVIKQRYIANEAIIDEVFTYTNLSSHPAWSAVSSRNLIEADTSTIQIFRSWNISNHPIQTAITRSVDLVKLEIDKDKVSTLFIVRHDGEIEDKLLALVGDNDNQIDFNGTMYGERDLWDLLTTNGATPYQLLDQRVPVLDILGRFNQY